MPGAAGPIQAKYAALRPLLDERTRRIWAATEARALGRGGISRVTEATGLSRHTVRAGLRELEGSAAPAIADDRQRRAGGGRKRLAEQNPQLVTALEAQLGPLTRGDPQGPLRWTCASAAQLAAQLHDQGHRQ